MKAEYNLSKMKARQNPYASKLKKPVTMRLSEDIIGFFKKMAEENRVPYQSLINLYLIEVPSIFLGWKSTHKCKFVWLAFLWFPRSRLLRNLNFVFLIAK